MKRWLRRFLRGVGIAALVAIAILFIAGLVILSRYEGKGGLSHEEARLYSRVSAQDLDPEAQFESDTCGLHSLRVVYKAYGLNPDKENLRARLGLNVPANPLDQSTTGTVQPDILQVLVQDGFRYELIKTDRSEAPKRLLEHLRAGNMAIVLIARRENGNMHWVAAHKEDAGRVMILDSLFEESYLEDPFHFFPEAVLSCILVQKKEEGVRLSPLQDGTEELFQTMRRYSAVKKFRSENEYSAESGL